jgi:phage/plasmid-like protein (TIGR03299 family)
MAHELEIRDGEASFAYNRWTGAPWHGLGTPVDGHGSAADMLRLAKADYEVELVPIYVCQPDGTYTPIPKRFATSRVDEGARVPFEVVRDRYHVLQNADVLERALAIVGASEGEAVMETVGVLGRGEKFFASIDLGTVVIDPAGAADKIGRYLLVKTSHDGTTPVVYSNTDVRAVCANTVRMAELTAHATFKARHTPNVEASLTEARRALGLSVAWGEAFAKTAEAMLVVPMTPNRLDTVINAVWAPPAEEEGRKAENHSAVRDSIHTLYANSRNAKAVGHNGWAAYNAVVEYIDHYAPMKIEARRTHAIEEGSLGSRRKVTASEAVLALA